MRHDDQNVHIAVFRRFSSGVRAEQYNPFRRKLPRHFPGKLADVLSVNHAARIVERWLSFKARFATQPTVDGSHLIGPEDKKKLVDAADGKQQDLEGIAGIERKLLEKNLAGIVTEDQFDNLMTEYRGIRLRSEAAA